MGNVLSALMSVLTSALAPVVGQVTPGIKTSLSEFLAKLYLDALKTPNVWDDFVVGLLLDLLGISRPSPPPATV